MLQLSLLNYDFEIFLYENKTALIEVFEHFYDEKK